MTESAADRFRIALDLASLGVELQRQNLRRAHPEATSAEIAISRSPSTTTRRPRRRSAIYGDAVLQPARHLGHLARWAIHRGRDEKAGHEALVAHAWLAGQMAADLPAGLSLSWLGVAGYALSYEGHTVLIDPYVTRLSLAEVARGRALPPDHSLVDAHVPTADAILIGHTHFDHALDAPAIARRDRCSVYGSASVATLLNLYGLGAHASVVEPYQVYAIGPFEVTFVPSAHSKLALGMWVPNAGPITCDSLDRLAPRAFNCDQVWGIHIGFTIDVGVAGFIEEVASVSHDFEIRALDRAPC